MLKTWMALEMAQAMKENLQFAAPDLFCPGSWLTSINFIHRFFYLQHSGCVQPLDGTNRRLENGRRVRLEHLFTQLPLLSKGLAFVRLLFSVSLTYPSPYLSSLGAVMAFRFCQTKIESFIVSFPNFAHTFLNTAFIKFSLITSIWVCHLFPAGIVGLSPNYAH